MSIVGLAREAAAVKITEDVAAVLAAPAHSAPYSYTIAAPPVTSTGPVENALTVLVKYIPTEVITLYVAAVSVGSAFKSVIPIYSPMLLYWAFIALCPLMFYLVYMSNLSSGKKSIPHVRNWPRWKPAASTIAFGVWALAIPNNPYVAGEAGAAVVGFAVIFVSIMLSLIAPIIERAD